MTDNDQLNYRWFILGLTVVTAAFVSTISVACLPPLFKEISEDLGLSLVQIGTVWGITNLAGIVISLLGGVLSDRFGVKVLLSVICILTGITGASRGLSYGFFTLSTTVFLHGTVRLIIGISLSKIIGLWFKGRNLGMAMGIFAMGMGLGLMLGQMISATILSPLLGGWRGVMYFYGVLAIAIGILWYLFGREPHETVSTADESIAEPFRQALSRLIRIRALWMLCVVPLTSLSDRLGVRKAFLVIAQIVTLVCFGLLPLVDGAPVWVLLILSGAFMDCFMAIMVTMVLETEGVGPEDYGTAIGISLTNGQVGSIVSPPLGNSLANLNMGLPFYFWALLSAAALFTLAPIKDSLAKIKDSRLQTSPSN
jgi:MFS family permease